MFWKSKTLFFLALLVLFFVCVGDEGVILNPLELNMRNSLKFLCIICEYPAMPHFQVFPYSFVWNPPLGLK